MSQVRSPKELFKHELQDMYYAEKTLATTLPKLARRPPTRSSRRAFTAHQKETEKHVANLEKVFKQVGESAQAHPCPGIDGIKKEHDDFMKENEPTPQMRTRSSRALLRGRSTTRSRRTPASSTRPGRSASVRQSSCSSRT